MTTLTATSRLWLIWALAVPLALLAGYLLATPDEMLPLMMLGMLLGVLALPVLLHWHHALLILSMNASFVLAFLPGSLDLWVMMAGGSLFLSVLARSLSRKQQFIEVPALTWTLLALAAVVFLTAQTSGGLGLRAAGSSVYGGKRYIYVFAAVMAYFALTARRIPPDKAGLWVGLYFAAGVTAAMSNLIYTAGPNFYFLFYIFPTGMALQQAMADILIEQDLLTRLTGVSLTGAALTSVVLCRWGVGGLLDYRRWWRALIFLALLGMSLLGGFRSVLILIALIFFIQFCLEGLHRTRAALGLGAAVILGLAVVIPFAEKLPLSVQRSLSVLPIQVSEKAKWDAHNSAQWRLDMWAVLVDEIPAHLWAGKGYSMNPSEYYLMNESVRRGLAPSYEMALLSGDYHNGPLSVIIPFGIWGVIAFLAFIVAMFWTLWRNWRHGPPALRTINTFFLAYASAKFIFFCAIFGALNSDLPMFAALAGLSVSLNGGVARDPAGDATPALIGAR